MQDDKVKTIADRILRAHLASFDYEGVDVRSGYDQDDEPALFIDAILGANAPAALGSALIDAHYQINKELLADGEERFPYLFSKRVSGDFPADVPNARRLA